MLIIINNSVSRSSRPIANKLILKLPITHMGEWLFNQKNDIDLPLSDLASMPQYTLYGNKTLAASRAPLKKKRVRVEIEEQRKPDLVMKELKCVLNGVNVFNKDDWQKMIEFMADGMIRMEKAFREPLTKIGPRIKMIDIKEARKNGDQETGS